VILLEKRTGRMRLPRSAAALLDELGITEPRDIEVEAIAQHCGATVLYEPLYGCEARIVGLGDRAIITVRDDVARGRQRFSVGHEIGHWLRDREQVAFACTERVFRGEWATNNPERRANAFAAELLLPERMFLPVARSLPLTLATVHSLAATFETSLTATAIRLIQVGPQPAMVVCSTRAGKRTWFFRSRDVFLWPHDSVLRDSVAWDIARGAAATGPADVDAAAWIDQTEPERYSLVEDSMALGPDLVLSLLWWKDERQLIDAAEQGDG
jgi:hypothetical protein